MSEKWTFGKEFCDYPTHYGKCGTWTPDGKGRCKRHKGLEVKKKRGKIGPYSGHSKWRDRHGEFQAKRGR